MSSNLKDAWVPVSGECKGCKESTLDPDELVKCGTCRFTYHMFCPILDQASQHCSRTFLKQFHKEAVKKPYFSWTCEPCSITKDITGKTALSHQVEKLTAQMETQKAQIENGNKC